MKTIFRLVVPALLSLAAAQAQPQIASILNNASYIVPPLPGSGIAQGSMFAVFGSNMGPAALVQAEFPLPTELSGTKLTISASGADVNAFLVYTLAGQLAAVLPSNTPLGPAVARVTYNGQTSAPFSFIVVRSSPGLFTLNGGGTGPAVLTTPDYQVITYTNAAVAGDALSAWGTGLTGLTGRPDNTGAVAFDPTLTVEVFVGGKLATVRYRGRAPGLAAVDQLVFDVPPGVQGCNVSLAVRVNGVISNYSSLAVGGANRKCSDANGLSENDLSNAVTSGLRFGTVVLSRVRTKVAAQGFTVESRTDVGSGSFFGFDANTFIRSQGFGTVSIGNCVVQTYSGESLPGDPVAVAPLNAGPQLTVTGPNGAKQITRQANGYYSAALGSGQVVNIPIPGAPPSTLFLDPGAYVITGPGGPDVGSFTARLTVPQPLSTNLDNITRVARGSSLEVTWTGGGSDEVVFVSGSSTRQNPTVAGTFYCAERASVGRIQVGSEVLLALPPSDSVAGAPLGFLTVGTAPLNNVGRFTATGIDVGFATYTSADGKNLPYE